MPCTLLLFFFALSAPAAETVDKCTVGDRTFEDFSQGQLGNAGANLYVSRSGSVTSINRWDFNRDGQIDLLVNNKHDFHWAPDLLIYWGRSEGFRSLTPPLWKLRPLASLLAYLDESPKWVTRLPAFGGGRSRVLDLNNDGYLDMIFCNFLHAEKTEMEAYLYWGGPEGFSVNRRSELPTLLASGLEAADLNRDGYIDLVFANFGLELGERFGHRHHLESYIYWGSSTGYDVKRRSSLPTVSAVDCTVADLNGDAFPDLVFLNNNSQVQNVYVYWGGQESYSEAHRTVLQCPSPRSVASADLNRDGFADLVITSKVGGVFLFFGGPKGVPESAGATLPGPTAAATAMADLNRDGILDLAFANPEGDSSLVYWGGAEGYDASRRISLPTLEAWGVTAGDLNGDSWPELIFANSSSAESNDVNSYVYWGSESGYNTSHRTELQTFGAVSAQVADLNQDGLRDIIFINQSSGKSDEKLHSYLYWGNPHHFYSEANMTLLPSVSADESSAADLNGDGFVDLVITNPYRDAPLYIYWGAKDGYAASRRAEIPLLDAYGASVADLNRDGHLDLLVSVGRKGVAGMGLAGQGLVENHGYASILWGGESGFELSRRQNLAIQTRLPFSNVLADLNKDGYLDLLFPDRDSDRIEILWGTKTGYDAKNSTLLPANSTPSLEVADLNGDGWLDIICPNGHDMQTMSRHTRSYIYFGSPNGFSVERRVDVESISAHEAAVADYNRDGFLDVAFTSYQGDAHRNVPTFIYWGGPDGRFSDSRRSLLPGHGGCGLVSADLNQDGYPDLFAWNHVKDGDHNAGSWIYWGGREGFTVQRRTLLSSAGPHYSMGVDIGNLYDRRPVEEFVSRPLEIPNGRHPDRVIWESDGVAGTGIRIQLRSAKSKEELSQRKWMGPSGPDGYYTRSGAPVAEFPNESKWVQYRVEFTGLELGSSQTLRSVLLECSPAE